MLPPPRCSNRAVASYHHRQTFMVDSFLVDCLLCIRYVINTFLSVYSLLQNSRTTTITVDLDWMTTQLRACLLNFAESFTCQSSCQRWRCMRVMIARIQTCELV